MYIYKLACKDWKLDLGLAKLLDCALQDYMKGKLNVDKMENSGTMKLLTEARVQQLLEKAWHEGFKMGYSSGATDEGCFMPVEGEPDNLDLAVMQKFIEEEMKKL